MVIAVGVVVALILIGTLLALGYNMRVFRIERSEVEEAEGDSLDFVALEEGLLEPMAPPDIPLEDDSAAQPDEPAEEAPPMARLPDGELVDLFSYFSEEEPVQEEPPNALRRGDEVEDDTPPPQVEEEYDRLSNLKSGRGYMVDCQKLLDQAQQNDILYAAICFDIDRFRFINSLKGHSIGDYILSRMSQDIVYLFPEGTLFSRLSADYFTAIFPLTDHLEDVMEEYIDGLRRICEKIRTDVGLKSSLRICMGVAVTHHGEDYDAAVLLQKANIARHCIKTSRTDTYHIFQSHMVSTYLFGESALEDYTENQYDDDFNLYYQPIANEVRNRVVGSDALARWICEEENNKDIEPSSENGRLPCNARKVIYHVCRTMSRWRKAGKEVLPVYVPLPATELLLEDIDGFLGRCLTEFLLEPHVICLMVDVAVLGLDREIIFLQIQKLRDMGIPVGIGGIDSSYSSLSFLENFHVDFIKLHKSVIHGAGESETVDHHIKKIMEYTDSHHIHAIFEGVDSKDQMVPLKELGVSMVQGRYCGGPSDADDFVRTLPEYLVHRESHNSRNEQTSGNSTVILDEAAFRQGNVRIF